jgi:hypothetical protein
MATSNSMRAGADAPPGQLPGPGARSGAIAVPPARLADGGITSPAGHGALDLTELDLLPAGAVAELRRLGEELAALRAAFPGHDFWTEKIYQRRLRYVAKRKLGAAGPLVVITPDLGELWAALSVTQPGEAGR